MLVAAFVLLLLVGLGSALLFLSQNELSMARSINDDKTAFHLAEAGIEAGRMSLLATNGSGSFDDDLAAAAGADVDLDLDPAILAATFAGDVPSGITGSGDDVPLRPLVALAWSNAGGYYAAFLSNDPAEGIGNQDDLNRRVMITSIGIGPNRATEVAQAIIEPNQPLPTVPPAAMTFLGPPPIYDNGSSNAQAHTGEDCPLGGGIPGLYVPIIGTTSSSSQTQVETDMQKPDNFTSGSLSGIATVANLTDPGDPALAQCSLPPIDPNWLDCNYVKQLVLDLIAQADYYCNTDNASCSPPPGNSGDVVVIDGDAAAATFTSGLLVVTGELSANGGDAWQGIVLVLGEGIVHRNGGGGGHSTGAVVLANIDPTPDGPRADKTDWCSAGFGQTAFTVNGGGNSTISYCSDVVGDNNAVRTYRVTEFLQR
jgi:hypothetical protein